MRIPFTPAPIQPSRDLFSMDRVPFPRLLREKIAQAELERERGELSSDAFDVKVSAWVNEAMEKAGLTYADGWNWYESPPARHNPQGVSSCWWRFRGNG